MGNDEQMPDEEDVGMPCVEVMVSGTMALMTGFAVSDSQRHRSLMARKIKSNLFFLGHHPGLTDPFRGVVYNMHAQWCVLVDQTEVSSSPIDSREKEQGTAMPSRALH